MNKKVFAFIVLSLLLCGRFGRECFAVPAYNGIITVKQADGTVLTLRLEGDEYLHYYRNVKTGERMIREKTTGQFRTLSAERFQILEAKAKLRKSRDNAMRLRRRPKHVDIGTIDDFIGKKKGLVVLVDFPDKKMTKTRQEYDDLFNKEGYNVDGHIGSVHDYFHDQSYGKFDLTFDVVGPYTVENRAKYYGENEESDFGGGDMYPAQMVSEALLKAYEEHEMDMSQYDWNGDSIVDQVFFVYAGYGENAGGGEDCIWAHMSTLYDMYFYKQDGWGPIEFAGYMVNTYACAAELRGAAGNEINGMGTACHEFSHCLGFPDFYDTYYSGGFGMSYLDLMHGGSYNGPSGFGEVPMGYTSYEKHEAGWLRYTPLDEGRTVSGMYNLADSAQAFVVYNQAHMNEYFLFENRKADRWYKYFNTFQGPEGLFVIHVNYNEYGWMTNTVNTERDCQGMTFVPARGEYAEWDPEMYRWILHKEDIAGYTFPGKDNVTALTEFSHADCGGSFLNLTEKGDYTFTHRLTDIKLKDGFISFNFAGGVHIDPPKILPATNITDDSFTANWETVDSIESYEVELTTTTIKNPIRPENNHLIGEDFSEMKGSGEDISSSINDNTHMKGFSAENVFKRNGFLQIGQFNEQNYQYKSGYLTTPTINCFSDTLFIRVKAGAHMGSRYTDNSRIIISIAHEDGKRVDPVSITLLNNEPLDSTIMLKGISGEQTITFASENAIASRTDLYAFDVWDGKVKDERQEMSVESGYERCPKFAKSSYIVSDITDTHYTFTGLATNCEYSYRVRARNSEGGYSKWSEADTLQFLSDPTSITDVWVNDQKSKVNGIFNLSGQRVGTDYKGIVIRKGMKYFTK